MKKILLYTIFVFLTNSLIAQNNSQTATADKVVNDLNHEIEKLKIQLENEQSRLIKLEGSMNEKIAIIEKNSSKEIEKLDSKLGYYIIFGSILIGFVGFLINFFGRQLIKERVEKLIQRSAFNYAQKVTAQVINRYISEGKMEEAIELNGQPAIEKIIKKLEKEGFMAIDGIKSKGDEVISSMLANHRKMNLIDSQNDDDINSNKESIRANEYFELAMSSKNPIVQISLYDKVLEIEPNNVEALNNIGVSYNNAYNYEKAISLLKKCIAIAPDFALAYANLANSYNLLNELATALAFVNQSIELNPTLDLPYSVKGNIYTKMGELEKAEDTFNKAIALNPNSPEAYFTRAYFYEETKQYEKSEQDYFKSASLGFPNKAMLFNNLAVLHRRKKDFDKAITYLIKAKKENSDFPNLDGTLALIYADKKDNENFYKYLILALDKGCPAWNYLSDPGFDDYRNESKLIDLLESYKMKNVA
jgi:tetratricopeptide (TPR) repeat protein